MTDSLRNMIIMQIILKLSEHCGFRCSFQWLATVKIQKKRDIYATGIEDERTAGLIADELEVRRLEGEEESKRFVVRGQIRAADGSPFRIIVRIFNIDMWIKEKMWKTRIREQSRDISELITLIFQHVTDMRAYREEKMGGTYESKRMCKC